LREPWEKRNLAERPIRLPKSKTKKQAKAMADLLAAAAAPLAATGVAARESTGKVVGLGAAQLGELTEQAIAWAAAHGLLVGWRGAAATSTAATFTHIPFCLLPVPVRRPRLQGRGLLVPLTSC
jgi:hypothetical protein